QRQLPTIRSRCQLVRFQGLSAAHVAQLLVEQQDVADQVEAEKLAAQAQGSLTRARELADTDLAEFCGRMLEELGRPGFQSVPLAKEINAFVEGVAKEAPPRRQRLRQLVSAACDFYRDKIFDRYGIAGNEETAPPSPPHHQGPKGVFRSDDWVAVQCL